jgi:hypothetical protein
VIVTWLKTSQAHTVSTMQELSVLVDKRLLLVHHK